MKKASRKLAVILLAGLIALCPHPARAWWTLNMESLITGTPLMHKWVRGKCDPDACELRSAYAPPAPFSANSKTEATLTVNKAAPAEGRAQGLREIMDSEIKNIRKTVHLAPYGETDRHKPKNNIASWTERNGNRYIGFIKYRATNGKGGAPFTVIHGIVRSPFVVYYAHLITFFGAHQDEVRGDQREILYKFMEKSPRTERPDIFRDFLFR